MKRPNVKVWRSVLLAIGVIAIIIGAIWIGQGFGVFRYPASSFMIGQPEWAYYGFGLAIVGAAMVGVSRFR